MRNDEKQFSIFERAVVVAIILLVSVMAVQDVLQSVKASEKRTLNRVTVEYAAVKNMYADQRQPVPPSVVNGNTTGAPNIHNGPVQ